MKLQYSVLADGEYCYSLGWCGVAVHFHWMPSSHASFPTTLVSMAVLLVVALLLLSLEAEASTIGNPLQRECIFEWDCEGVLAVQCTCVMSVLDGDSAAEFV